MWRPAEDRNKLAAEAGILDDQSMRTRRRRERIEAVLARRQPDLTVVIENVHDPHNISAVVRSCDAVGILQLHLVYTIEPAPTRGLAGSASSGAQKWIEPVLHDSVESCYAELRLGGAQIIAVDVGASTGSIHHSDLSIPTALVFGNEMRGLSEAATAGADRSVHIPMFGMVESLNLSVACAVCLFEALRQRDLRGMYGETSLSPERVDQLKNEWLRR